MGSEKRKIQKNVHGMLTLVFSQKEKYSIYDCICIIMSKKSEYETVYSGGL